MAGYDDPKDPGNSDKYKTGKKCIDGCGREAGTAWGPHWCFECNIKRLDGISKQFEKMTEANND